jgi:hypothetical protein
VVEHYRIVDNGEAIEVVVYVIPTADRPDY